jgi:hypothetical protein
VNDPLLPYLLLSLQLVVAERLHGGAFALVGRAPAWFLYLVGAGAEAAAKGRHITLGQVFPFLDPFLADAERFWAKPGAEPLRSEPFAATNDVGEQVFLRATALSVQRRNLLVFERLGEVLETQAVLQTARDQALEHERLRARMASLGKTLEGAARVASDLRASGLPPAQEALAERLAGLIEKLQGVAAGR